MNPLVVVRVIHYVAIAQAFGALVFAVTIAPPRGKRDEATSTDRQVIALARGATVVAVASWLAWLPFQASAMAGVSWRDVFDGATLERVIHDTSFGHVWLLRFVVMLALAAIIALPQVRARSESRAALDAGACLLAALAMATLAASGHASATTGSDKVVHLTADSLHLVAAGAWLGSLIPLGISLRSVDSLRAQALATRFSIMGVVCVGTLIPSGVVNSLYLVAGWPAFFATAYGQLLIAKLALFAAMVALAASNRLRWTPMLGGVGGEPAVAPARIARNALAEATLGALILAIVGVLGVTVPGAHDQTQWPFSFRLAFDATSLLPSIEPAYPTTYSHAPFRYSVTSVAQGAAIYERQCAACHGADGHGGGPTATQLAKKPPDLGSVHMLGHQEGDLFWWITHGIAGTSMPAFGERLDDSSRWDLVHFVRTLAAAAALQAGVAAKTGVAAPEFTYQINAGVQQTLAGSGEQSATLLVLFALPESRGRLTALAAAAPELAREGLRIVAVPRRNGGASAGDARADAIIADASPDVDKAYGLLAGDIAPRTDRHLEFLIARNGRLRAQWDAGSALPPGDLVERLAKLDRPTRGAHPPTHQH